MNTINAACLITKQPISYYENKHAHMERALSVPSLKFRDCIGIQSRSVSPRSQMPVHRCLASGEITLICNF